MFKPLSHSSADMPRMVKNNQCWSPCATILLAPYRRPSRWAWTRPRNSTRSCYSARATRTWWGIIINYKQLNRDEDLNSAVFYLLRLLTLHKSESKSGSERAHWCIIKLNILGTRLNQAESSVSSPQGLQLKRHKVRVLSVLLLQISQFQIPQLKTFQSLKMPI